MRRRWRVNDILTVVKTRECRHTFSTFKTSIFSPPSEYYDSLTDSHRLSRRRLKSYLFQLAFDWCHRLHTGQSDAPIVSFTELEKDELQCKYSRRAVLSGQRSCDFYGSTMCNSLTVSHLLCVTSAYQWTVTLGNAIKHAPLRRSGANLSPFRNTYLLTYLRRRRRRQVTAHGPRHRGV